MSKPESLLAVVALVGLTTCIEGCETYMSQVDVHEECIEDRR